MPDLNSGLLQIGDLGNQIQLGRQAARQDQQQLLGSIGALIGTAGTVRDNQALNDALAANFDPATGQLNQQGVIAQMYKYKPQMAQELGQKYAAQSMANQKLQGELGKLGAETAKIGAEAGKIGSETQSMDLKRVRDEQDLVGQTILGIDPANPNSVVKAINFARSKGLDTSLFDDIDPRNPAQVAQAKSQAMNMLMTAKEQTQAEIDRMNADSARMNATTAQQKAGQDYALGVDKNSIDLIEANTRRSELSNKIATAGMITPQQQFENSLKLQKEQNDLQGKKLDDTSKIQEKVNSLAYTNGVLNGFVGNAKRILDLGLLTSGKDKNGDYIRDKDGKIVPADSNLGNIWGNARMKWEPGSNEYKQFASEYGTLVGVAKGKTMAEFKTAIGSTGPVTDADAKNFAAMQGLPDTPDDFAKLSPTQRVDALDTIVKLNEQAIKNNENMIKREQKRAEAISKQSISAPQVSRGLPPMPAGGAGYPSGMPAQSAQLPGGTQPGQVVFKAPNGVALTQEMIDRIEASMGKKRG